MVKLEKQASVNGAVVYVDGELVGEGISFTNPTVNFGSIEIEACGSMSVPDYTRIDAMEVSITHVGLDKGFRKSITPERHLLDFRWSSNVVGLDGKTQQVGHKLICYALPKTIPSIAVSIGEAGENEVTFDCLSCKLIDNGTEVYNIDKMAGKIVVNGVDCVSATDNLLYD